jgi:hypothetical protein
MGENGVDTKCVQNFGFETPNGRDSPEDLRVGMRIILTCVREIVLEDVYSVYLAQDKGRGLLLYTQK